MADDFTSLDTLGGLPSLEGFDTLGGLNQLQKVDTVGTKSALVNQAVNEKVPSLEASRQIKEFNVIGERLPNTLADFRKLNPDATPAQEEEYRLAKREEILQEQYQENILNQVAIEQTTAAQLAKDLSFDFTKGAVGVVETGYGLADVGSRISGGITEKALQDLGIDIDLPSLDEALGLSERFERAREAASELQSEERQLQRQEAQLVDEFVDVRRDQRINKDIHENGNSEFLAAIKEEGFSIQEKAENLITNPGAILGTAIESVPNLLSMGGIGGITIKAALKKELKDQANDPAAVTAYLATERGKKVVSQAAARSGIGYTAASEGLSNGYQAQNKILKLSEAEVKALPDYEYYTTELGMTHDEAHRQIAEDVFNITASTAAVIAASGAKVTGAGEFFGKLGLKAATKDIHQGVVNRLGGGIIGKGIAGFLKETPEEFIQSAGGVIAENIATGLKVDTDKATGADIIRGSGRAGTEGAFAGGLSGGAVGATGGVGSDAVITGKVISAGAEKLSKVKLTKDDPEEFDPESSKYDADKATANILKNLPEVTAEDYSQKLGEASEHAQRIYDQIEQAEANYTNALNEAGGDTTNETVVKAQKRLEHLQNKKTQYEKIIPDLIGRDALRKNPENEQLKENVAQFISDPEVSDEQFQSAVRLTFASGPTKQNTKNLQAIVDSPRATPAMKQAATTFLEIKDLEDVSEEVMIGSDARPGIAKYTETITNALATNNQNAAVSTLNRLAAFANKHKDKYQRLSSMIQEYQDKGDTPRYRQMLNEYNILHPTQTGKPFFLVHPKTGSIQGALTIQKRMVNEIQALDQAVTANSQLVGSEPTVAPAPVTTPERRAENVVEPQVDEAQQALEEEQDARREEEAEAEPTEESPRAQLFKRLRDAMPNGVINNATLEVIEIQEAELRAGANKTRAGITRADIKAAKAYIEQLQADAIKERKAKEQTKGPSEAQSEPQRQQAAETEDEAEKAQERKKNSGELLVKRDELFTQIVRYFSDNFTDESVAVANNFYNLLKDIEKDGTVSFNEVVDLLIEAFPTVDHPQRLILKQLQSVLNEKGIGITAGPGTAVASWDAPNNNIVLHPEFFQTVDKLESGKGSIFGMMAFLQHVLAHEFIHAATHAELTNNPQFAGKIQAMMDEVLTLLPIGDLDNYAFTNQDEFVAEALTNATFQRILAQLPVSDELMKTLGLKKADSLWSAFVQLVAQTFNYPVKTNNQLDVLATVVATYTDLPIGDLTKTLSNQTFAFNNGYKKHFTLNPKGKLKDTRAVTALQEEINNAKSEEDADYFREVQQFVQDFVQEFSNTNPNVQVKDKPFENAPQQMLMVEHVDGSYNYPQQVLDNLALVALNWVSTRANGTLFTDKAIVNKILGRDEDTPLTPDEELLLGIGVPMNSTAEDIGLAVLDGLGAKFYKDKAARNKALKSKDTDGINGHLKRSIAVGLGLSTLHTLQNMGILEFRKNELPKNLTDEFGEPIFVQEANFIKVLGQEEQLEDSEHSRTVPIDRVRTLADGFSESDIRRETLAEMNGSEVGVLFPSTKPMKRLAKDSMPRTSQELSDDEINSVEKHAKVEWTSKKVSHLLGNMSKMSKLLMQGYRTDLDEGNIHETERTSLEAKNNAIEREVDIADKFLENQSKKEGGLDGTFYFHHFIAKTRRIFLKGDFNPQTKKMHRHMVTARNWVVDIVKDDNSNAMRLFKLAVAEGLGVSIDKMSTDEAIAKFDELVQRTDVKNAIEAINFLMGRDSTIVDSDTLPQTAQEIAEGFIVEAVNNLGEKYFSLDALVALSEYQNTKKGEVFKTDLFREVDGITNGVILGLMQFGGDVTVNELFRKLNKGGVYEKGNSFQDFEDFRTTQGNLDHYENLSDGINKILGELVKAYDDNGVNEGTITRGMINLATKGEGFTDSETGTISKIGRTLSKLPLMTIIYGATPKKAIEALGKQVLYDTYKRLARITADFPDTADQQVELQNIETELKYALGIPQYSKFTLFDKELTTWKLGPALEEQFLTNFAATYGKALQDTIEKEYADFREKRQQFNNVLNFAHKIFYRRLKAKVAEAEAANGGNPISDEELVDIIDSLNSIAPIITNAFSQTLKEGILFTKEKRVRRIKNNDSEYLRVREGKPVESGAVGKGPSRVEHSSNSPINFTVLDDGVYNNKYPLFLKTRKVNGQKLHVVSIRTKNGVEDLGTFKGKDGYRSVAVRKINKNDSKKPAPVGTHWLVFTDTNQPLSEKQVGVLLRDANGNPVNEITFDNDGYLVTPEAVKTTKTQRGITAVPSEIGYLEPGVAGGVIGIHQLDAAIILELMKQKGILNIHDAAGMPITDVDEYTKILNKAVMDFMSNYSLMDEAAKLLVRVADELTDTERAETDTRTTYEFGKPVETTYNVFNDLVSQFRDAYNAAIGRRTEMFDQISSITQYNGGKDGIHEVANPERVTVTEANTKQAVEDLLFNSVSTQQGSPTEEITSPVAPKRRTKSKYVTIPNQELLGFPIEDGKGDFAFFLHTTENKIATLYDAEGNQLPGSMKYNKLEDLNTFFNSVYTQMIKDGKLGANRTPLDENAFVGVTPQIVTSETTVSVFNQLGNLGPVRETTEHQRHLKNLLEGMVNTVIRPIDMLIAQSGEETIGDIDVSRRILRIQAAAHTGRGLLSSGIKMSAQEVFVHELIHAITAIGINNAGKAARNKLERLFKLAEIHTTAADFMRKNDNGDVIDINGNVINPGSAEYIAEEQLAQERYDYIFNNRTPAGADSDMNPYLHEFMAFGLTNAQFIKKLATISVTKGDLRAPSSQNVFVAMKNLFDQIMDILFDRATKADTADQVLLALAYELRDTQARKQSKVMAAMEQGNESTKTAINEWIVKPIKRRALEVPAGSSGSGTKDLLDALVVGAATDLSGWDRMLRQVVNRQGQVQGDFATVLNEVMGTQHPFHKAFETLRRLASKNIEQARIHVMTAVKEQLLDAFQTQLNKAQRVAITRAFLMTDVVSLLPGLGESVTRRYDLADIYQFLTDSTALTAEINRIEAQIHNLISDDRKYYYTKQAQNLGSFMATKNTTEQGNLAFNAETIVDGWGQFGEVRAPSNARTRQTVIELVDTLTTLQAIKFTDTPSKTASAQLILDDSDGVMFTLATHRSIQEMAKEKTFNGQEGLMMKGYVSEQFNPYRSHQIGTWEDGEKLLARGYSRNPTPIKRDPRDPANQHSPNLYIYTLPYGQQEQYDQGAVSVTRSTHKGTNQYTNQMSAGDPAAAITAGQDFQRMMRIKRAEARAIKSGQNTENFYDNTLIPVYNSNGEIVDFRYVMSEKNKREILEKDEEFNNVLGHSEANILDKVESKEANRKAVELAKLEYDTRFDREPGAYINVGPQATDPKAKEMWNLIPDQMKQDVFEIWGDGGMYVHQVAWRHLFGQRRFGISSIQYMEKEGLNALGKAVANTNNLMDFIFTKYPLTYKAGLFIENNWKDVVTWAKDVIVIKSIVVLKDNILSNQVTLMAKGLSPKQAYRDQIEAFVAGKEYQRKQAELNKAERELRVGLLNAQERARKELEIDRLKSDLVSNPVHELFQAGVYQSIVEDIYTLEDVSKFKKGYERLIEPIEEKIPLKARKIISTFTLSHGTPLYEALKDMTQMSDFMARYALHKHNKRNGMSHNDSIQNIVKTFIDYDAPTSAAIQYANDLGLYMFTKFNFRNPQVVLDIVKERPLSAAIVITLQGILGHAMPSIFGSLMNPPGFQSPTDILESGFTLHPLYQASQMVLSE